MRTRSRNARASAESRYHPPSARIMRRINPRIFQKPEIRSQNPEIDYTPAVSQMPISGFRLLLFASRRRGGTERECLVGGLGWPKTQAKHTAKRLRQRRRHVLFGGTLSLLLRW